MIFQQNDDGLYTHSYIKEILFTIKSGIPNEDHRGSDHFAYILDFHPIWSVTLPTSVKTIVDGLYRIRSHKTENFYCMYSSAKVELLNNRSTLSVEVTFDYGS